MKAHVARVNPIKRLAYAFVGLLVGDVILFSWLLTSALRTRALLLKAQMGEPTQVVPAFLQVFALYAIFSFVGWLFVGLPIALFFSPRFLLRSSWPLRLLIGAALGPLALFAILVLLSHGPIRASFVGTGMLWAFSIVVSTASFLTYLGLLRNDLGG